MSYRRLALGVASPCLMFVILCGWCGAAAAQGSFLTDDFGDSSATLTVSARPLQAEIRLDGALLGSAHDLLARALPMIPGDHVVEIFAPGYLPRMVYVPGTPNWASQVRVELVPVRQP